MKQVPSEALAGLGTAGSDVRARISADGANPLLNLGESPAGVDAAVGWFEHNFSAGSQIFLFLVGGPGGGKSHTAARIASKLEQKGDPHPQLAHRKHLFVDDSGNELVVINDATMRGREHENFPLLRDIKSALIAKQSLVCCVNRGILVEEMACMDPELAESKLVLDVLLESSDQARETGVMSRAWYPASPKKIDILTVNFDLCSLFEVSPECNFTSQGKLEFGEYKVASFKERFRQPLEVPAIRLIREVVRELANELAGVPAQNPIASNLHSLQSEKSLMSISTICRAAEVIAGRRFTYRELWGLTSRLILGNLPNVASGRSVRQCIDDLDVNYQDFEKLIELAEYRIPFALFGVGKEGAEELKQVDPVLAITRNADPLLDMRPGTFLDDPLKGWADTVHDAFSGAMSANSPLDSLKLTLHTNEKFTGFLSEFDNVLDEAFVKIVENSTDKKRSVYISQYSRYLSRLYAVSQGISAHLNTVTIWSSLWSTSPVVNHETTRKILTLVRPRRVIESAGSNSSSLIPLFDSRTNPIIGTLKDPVLSLRVNDLDVETQTSGDSIFLILKEHNQTTAKVLLDFPLLREAEACIPNFQGITERSSITAPRLERMRASNLVPDFQNRKNDFRVATNEGEIAFKVPVRKK